MNKLSGQEFDVQKKPRGRKVASLEMGLNIASAQ